MPAGHRGVAILDIPDILDILDIYNGYLMFGDEARLRMFYTWLDEKARAEACIECGECLREASAAAVSADKCPQGIKIPGLMKVVHEALAQIQV